PHCGQLRIPQSALSAPSILTSGQSRHKVLVTCAGIRFYGLWSARPVAENRTAGLERGARWTPPGGDILALGRWRIMEVLFAVLADDMSMRPDDRKANITGAIIEPLRIARFPYTFPSLLLHFVLTAQPEEQRIPHTIKFQVDGLDQEAGSARETLDLDLSADASVDGSPIYLTLTANFDDLSFPHPGPYTFSIQLDGVLAHSSKLVLALAGM
ncbi:MAG: hypothetical protein NTZ05_17740, partial [Chloroflexi bacterium]|nr:hypothetical protein [Chloroflexota bacterium]